MPVLAKKRLRGVRNVILQVINQSCPEVSLSYGRPRHEERVNLVVPVVVVPVERGELFTQQAFTAVTKEFSSTGMAIVLDRPMGLDEVIVGVRRVGELVFLRAHTRHLTSIGGGFFQLGFRLTEVVHAGDYPVLESVML